MGNPSSRFPAEWSELAQAALQLRAVALAAQGKLDETEDLIRRQSGTDSREALKLLAGLTHVAADLPVSARTALGRLQLNVALTLEPHRQTLSEEQRNWLDRCLIEANIAVGTPLNALSILDRQLEQSPRDSTLLKTAAELYSQQSNQNGLKRSRELWQRYAAVQPKGSTEWLTARYELAVTLIALGKNWRRAKAHQTDASPLPRVRRRAPQGRVQGTRTEPHGASWHGKVESVRTIVQARIGLIALLVLAALIRIGWVTRHTKELTEDRDAYLSLANSLSAGNGYASPEGGAPTAYRPPLYPLLLAASPVKRTAHWVAFTNVAFGVVTVLVTCVFARRLELSWGDSLSAGLVVALDPLLVRYSSLPMTETLCTCLVTAFLTMLVGQGSGPRPQPGPGSAVRADSSLPPDRLAVRTAVCGLVSCSRRAVEV